VFCLLVVLVEAGAGLPAQPITHKIILLVAAEAKVADKTLKNAGSAKQRSLINTFVLIAVP
jgi:hypothetical protein